MMILTRPVPWNDSFLNCLRVGIDLTRHYSESGYDVVFDLRIILISENVILHWRDPSSSKHFEVIPPFETSSSTLILSKDFLFCPSYTPRHIYNNNKYYSNHVVRPHHHPQLGQPSLYHCRQKRRQPSRGHVFPRSTYFARVALCLRCESRGPCRHRRGRFRRGSPPRYTVWD